jgi:23S rRNA G2445 N2-methylase RlmL
MYIFIDKPLVISENEFHELQKKTEKIYASDFDSNIIPLAKKNLSLLGLEGLNERISEINKMINDYKKESHVYALNSALRLKNLIEKRNNYIDIECFVADITKDDIKNIVDNIDIVITDLPYGDIVEWSGGQNENDAVSKFLDNVLKVLAEKSIVAVVSQKKTVVKHDKFKRAEQFAIGKRKITLLQPINI